MRSIIVTGGAGFVGSNLVDALLADPDNETVMVIDDLSNGTLGNLKSARSHGVRLQFFKRDIAQIPPDFFHKRKFDELYHLVCYPRQISFKDPWRDMQVNVGGAIRSLELARASGAKMLFTSNTGIVSKPNKLPVDEQSSPNPLTPYDCHKLTVEYLMQAWSKYYDLKTVIVRFATVYGPRQRVNEILGWRPVIPEFCGKLAKGLAPTVDGDGLQTRDFLNVRDAVQGVIKAMRCEKLEANNGGMFILGTGKEVSILAIFNEIAHQLSSDLKPIHGPPKSEDIARMLYDSTKASNTFGYAPQVSLASGLSEVVNWIRTQ